MTKNTVPALVITPEKVPVVSGNFDEIRAWVQNWKTEVKSVEMTEENMAVVRTIKKEAVQLRNSLMKLKTEVLKLYFNDPKAVVAARMDEVIADVVDVEQDADGVLAIEENERLENINQVLNFYKEKFQKEHRLDPEYLERIEYRKSYYNKTADEKERKDDLEKQFKELKKEQLAYKGNVKLIEAACNGEPRLNVQHWLDKLYSIDVASILEDIEAEKERFKGLDSQTTQTTTSSASTTTEPKTILGIAGGIDFSTDFPGRNKTMQVQISYPCDLGSALTELFTHLKQFGVKIKTLKEEALF